MTTPHLGIDEIEELLVGRCLEPVYVVSVVVGAFQIGRQGPQVRCELRPLRVSLRQRSKRSLELVQLDLERGPFARPRPLDQVGGQGGAARVVEDRGSGKSQAAGR